MSRKLILSPLFLILLVAVAQAAKRDDGVATSFSADCICDQGNGYLNAYTYQIPLSPQRYKPGTVITVSANSCQYLMACKVRALLGTYKMRIDTWNSNTANVYKFAINGPKQ